jgi:hypothetical protein
MKALYHYLCTAQLEFIFNSFEVKILLGGGEKIDKETVQFCHCPKICHSNLSQCVSIKLTLRFLITRFKLLPNDLTWWASLMNNSFHSRFFSNQNTQNIFSPTSVKSHDFKLW